MKKASLVIKEIQEGTYNDVLKDIWIRTAHEQSSRRYHLYT